MHDVCKGEYNIMAVKTIEKQKNNIKVTVTNFPIQNCSECDEYLTNLADGVKVDVYMRRLMNAGFNNLELKVDFPTIEALFEGKDIFEEMTNSI